MSETLNMQDKKVLDIQKEHEVIKEKISKMNLTEMRSYARNNIQDFLISDYGLLCTLRRLTLEDKESKMLYIQESDMDVKKKKAFDVMILLATNKCISIEAIEVLQLFLEVYADIIAKYDTQNKDIYASRILQSINSGLSIIGIKSDIQSREELL